MKLHLVDLNPDVVAAWRAAFVDHPEVNISEASILDVATDAIVSPANSHGFMDGGIDRVYLLHFGQQLQDSVRSMVYRRSEEMLPIGAAELAVHLVRFCRDSPHSSGIQENYLLDKEEFHPPGWSISSGTFVVE